MENKFWDDYKGKRVRLIVKDGNKVRPRDGIFIGIDLTHLFLQLEEGELPVPYLREDIKRMELKDDGNGKRT